jgi:hypothetical protein
MIIEKTGEDYNIKYEGNFCWKQECEPDKSFDAGASRNIIGSWNLSTSQRKYLLLDQS